MLCSYYLNKVHYISIGFNNGFILEFGIRPKLIESETYTFYLPIRLNKLISVQTTSIGIQANEECTTSVYVQNSFNNTSLKIYNDWYPDRGGYIVLFGI